MRRTPALLAAALAAAVTTACGGAGDAPAAAWQTVTDTLGDTIVVRTVGAADTAALLRLVPELRIGDLDGADEYHFGSVMAVVPAPGGGAYVFDQTLVTLRHYDSAGTYVRQIGRRGAGPGEYEAANGMVVLRDGRLVLWDPRNARLNVYDAGGAPAGSWRSPSNLYAGQGAMHADTAGHVYVLAWLREPPGAVRREPVTALVRLGPDGTVGDTLVPTLPEVPDASLVASREGRTTFQRVPYAPRAVWTFTPAGEFVTGEGSRYALTVHRAAAPLRIERDVPPVAVAAAEGDDARDYITGQLRDVDPSYRWSGPAVPARKPFFGALRTDADGRLWVQRATPGERIPDDEYAELAAQRAGPPTGRPEPPPRRWREPTAFDVFQPDGRFVGHVRVPPRTTLHHMRGDRVWGVQRDELDVPYVVRFRLAPAIAGTDASTP